MFFSKTADSLPQEKGLPLFKLFSDIRSTFGRSLIFSKLLLVSMGVSLLFGYTPALDFPPIKHSVVQISAYEETVVSVPTIPFQLPHPGYISTKYAFYHPGIDIATGLGMPVKPISDGKVAEVTLGYFGLGHYVVVEHAQGYRSTYGHMGRIYVSVGDQVKATTILGEVGLTGHTSGPHTHLEVTKEGNYINPLAVLPGLPDWPDPATYSGPHYENAPVGGADIRSIQPKEEKREIDMKKELKFTL